MARLKLEMPGRCLGTFPIPVRVTDINYGNHVGNDSMVSILHEARMQLLRQIHCTEMDVFGTSLTMSELQVIFLRESFYGDDLLVSLYAGDISRVSFELFYSVSTREGNTGEMARAKTVMVCFNYTSRKMEAVPGALQAFLSGD